MATSSDPSPLLSARAPRLECRNGVRRIQPFVVALGAIALLQCASNPSPKFALPPEARVVIAYEQPRQGLRQTILGDRVVDPASFYSDKDSDKLAKIASAAQMQILVDGLAECGYFAAAKPRPDTDAVSLLKVEIEGVPQFWSLSGSTPIEARAGYHQALAWFQNVYNQIGAFHTGEGDFDPAAETERIRRENEARRLRGRERP